MYSNYIYNMVKSKEACFVTGDYEIVFEQNEENIEFLKLKNGLIDTEKATNILKENKIHLTENLLLRVRLNLKM